MKVMSVVMQYKDHPLQVFVVESFSINFKIFIFKLENSSYINMKTNHLKVN